MSEPWWIATPDAPPTPGPAAPQLVAGRPRDVMRAIRGRRAAFTPDWIDPPAADAGGALAQLFAEMTATLAERVNGTAARPGIPERARREFFTAAGVRPRPGTIATAQVQFTVSPTAGQSVRVPAKFQVAAAGKDRIIFETQADLVATPLAVEVVRTVTDRGDRLPFAVKDQVLETPAVAFGQARPGEALELGLGGTGLLPAAPGPELALAFDIAAEGGPAAVAGGEADPEGPRIKWLVGTGTDFTPAAVVGDGTRGLTRAGIVVLRPPAGWKDAVFEEPVRGKAPPPRYWVRAEFAGGRLVRPPSIAAVRTNVVAVRAVRTVRDEFPVMSDDARRRANLRVTPVVPKSVRLEVSRPALTEAEASRLSDRDAAPAGPAADVWEERESLATAGPADRVFTLDPLTGELGFGDGTNGAAVPQGARMVVAKAYEVDSRPPASVAAKAISQLISAAPFVTKVTNPAAVTRGADPDSTEDAIRRGTQTLRSRGRAVVAADYEVLAREAPGADVRRAKAVPHRDPSAPGRPAPGVVGVWIVSTPRPAASPEPDSGTLRAVADYLSAQVAPPGVRVVVATPRFRRIQAELQFHANPAADPGAVAGNILAALDDYFDPLTGGTRPTAGRSADRSG